MTAQRLSALGDAVPDLGDWFEALTAQMSGGDPPVERFAAGEAIVRAGDVADRFFVVLSGEAFVQGASADEPPLAVEHGALLGELGVLFGGRRRRTVVAASPVIAISGTRDELERALGDERIGAHVASVAARRLAERVQPILATTSKGLRVALHPQLPAHRALYAEAFGSLSLESLRTRFFAPRRPPQAVLERLLHIDYVDHVAWVAEQPADRGGRPLGIARFIVSADDPGNAEIAISIVDAYQGRGLGRLLVGTLGCVAQTRGLETFTALVLADNHGMRAVFDRARAAWTRFDIDVVEAHLAVADVAALLDDDTAQRVAAASRQVAQAARLADA
jgi:protein lysine acetyltransferase